MPEGLRAEMMTKGMPFSPSRLIAASVKGVILCSGFSKVPSTSLNTIFFIDHAPRYRKTSIPSQEETNPLSPARAAKSS